MRRVFNCLKTVKMVSAQFSSNTGKNKVTKKTSYHGNSFSTANKNLPKI